MRLLRLKEVQRRTTLPASEIYARMKTDTFPKQIRIGSRRVAWDEDDVSAWHKQQLEENKHIPWGDREVEVVGT